MEKYEVTGMSCAACSARVEKAVSKVSGVENCQVNLLTKQMTVFGNANESDIIKAVVDAGYNAYKKGEKINKKQDDSETSMLKLRLYSSVGFLIVLMYFSMGHTMWNLPLPSFFEHNHIANGIVQLLLTIVIMVINKAFFISGFKGLIKKTPNMDSLVALGSGASFVYSLYALFKMTDAQVKGDLGAVMNYMHEFYFESSAMILTLITVGKMLESYSKGKTTNALKSLIDLSPKTAILLKDGVEIEVPAAHIKKGDIFIVKAGGSIPADGVIIEGHCTIDESVLTGESVPVDKEVGNFVSAATINQFGYIKCEAQKVGEDTALSQIIKMVSDASASKAPISKTADKVSGFFVPVVIVISVITTLVWLILGEGVGFSLARGISVLVISCPCALGLATPVAIMVGNGVGAKNGILFKNAVSLEETGKVKVVALDKTGTITSGKPVVTDIIPFSNVRETELIQKAYSLEIKSEHPLAKAVVKKATEMNILPVETTNFEVLAGNGIKATLEDNEIYGGNLKFISQNTEISDDINKIYEKLTADGKTPLFFKENNHIIGIIAVSDQIKEDSPASITKLKKMGIKVVMITGDNKRTANAVKMKTGIDEVRAEVLPIEKEKIVKELKKYGKVAMVGDGINDAPALTSADVGVAIGAGTDIAIDSADIVLMKNSLYDVATAILLSRQTLKNIRENLFWAFIYNIIGIPLAMGVWIPIFGWKLNPMFGAFAMSLSSVCVVTNALRLNFFKVNNNEIKKKEEKKVMEITMKIEGMMCGHCEARVKKCLEETEGVTEASVSHEKNTAVVKMDKEIPYEILKNIVENQGYTVVE